MNRSSNVSRNRGNYNTLAILLALIAVGVLAFLAGLVIGRFVSDQSVGPESVDIIESPTSVRSDNPTSEPTLTYGQDISVSPTANASTLVSPTGTVPPPTPTNTPVPVEGPFIYGHSFNGNELLAYRLATGSSARALIGGIHGGYEWNTTVLMSDTLAHLQEHPEVIPSDVMLYIIPCANPDGAEAGTDAIYGRMNGNGVDLNRNWDYHWQMTATHGTRPVSAGSAPFSEPETEALRGFFVEHEIEAAIFYHSAMGKIFSGAERDKSATFQLAEMMSEVTGYPHAPEGVMGQITTGDAIDYLSTQGVAAIEIELTTHEDTDWDQNWRGVEAFLRWTIPGTVWTEEGDYIRYVLQPGDTLLAIAIEYGVTTEDIVAANDSIVDEEQIIRVGQVILIPATTDD
jgi:hypothetical protein